MFSFFRTMEYFYNMDFVKDDEEKYMIYANEDDCKGDYKTSQKNCGSASRVFPCII